MALRDWTLTLTGSAQQLSSVLSDTTRGGKVDEALRMVCLQGDPANTAVVYVGSSSAVSSSSYGVAVPIPIATNNPTSVITFSFSHSGPMKLSDFWVVGTNGQKLHILAIPF